MGLLCGETPQNIRCGLERPFIIWPTHYNVVVVFAAQAVRVLSCVFWLAKTFHRDIVSSFFHRPNINCIHGASPFLSLPTYPAPRAVWACCVVVLDTVHLESLVDTATHFLSPCCAVHLSPFAVVDSLCLYACVSCDCACQLCDCVALFNVDLLSRQAVYSRG